MNCPDCGTPLLKLGPPRSERTGSDGLPMTRAEAIHLFVDTRGGRCTECYLVKCDQELKELAARHRADPTIRTRPWPDFGGFWKPQQPVVLATGLEPARP